jgi:uncharacterized membrane protein YedE/YeeE
MTAFTPVSALLGGLLIGLAAVLLLAMNGRIAGVSGIAAGLLARPHTTHRLWRVLFLLGLMLGAWLFAALGGPVPAPRPSPGPGWLVVAGLLAGFGTTMAGGCTSGHGVCGLARLSLRSLVAVAVFLGCAFATVYVVRHFLGLS